MRSTVIPTGRKAGSTIYSSIRSFVTEASSADQDQNQNQEKVIGETKKKTFQAETRKLLDIVTHSLYSEKEVFVR